MVKRIIKNFYQKYFLIIIIGIHCILLLSIHFFPYPELFVYPYLRNNGLIPYKQIFDQHFPGVMFFPLNLDTLGIDSPTEMQIVQLGLVLCTHILLFVISRKLLSKKFLFAPNFLYLMWQPFFEGYVLWIDSFMPLFLLSSFYFSISYKKISIRKSIFFSGFTLGLALLFKQVLLPLIFVMFLFWLFKTRNVKYLGVYCLGVLIPVLYLALYIIKLEVISEFIYWTVTFNVTTFAEFGRKFASLSDLLKIMPVFGSAILGSLYLLKIRGAKNILIVLYFTTTLIFAYARFDLVHLQPSLPFALIILTITLDRFRKNRTKLLIIYCLISVPLLIYFYKGHLGRKVYFYSDVEINLSEKVRKYVSKGDTVFAFATMPHIYSLSDTLPPGRVFVFQFPWFMLEAEDEILQGIVNNKPKLIVREPLAIADDKILLMYMQNIDKYIKGNYQIQEVSEGIEFWMKK